MEVFEKITKLHAKTSFQVALILGDLFANPAEESEGDDKKLDLLMRGDVNVPLPTYFTLGRHPLPQRVIDKLEDSDGEICPNLYFLGKRSTTKISEGLRIVALGGLLDPEITAGLSKDKYLPFHTEGDAKALHGANSADILVTSNWPSSIRSGSKVQTPDDVEDPLDEQCLADLCSALKPRYHFSTSDSIFYEREPFFHLTDENQPDTSSITRFISLASHNNPSKQKWLYAFSLDPSAAPPSTMPAGTTVTPLGPSRKRQREPDNPRSYSRFSNHNGDHYRPKKRYRQAPPGPQECFFCLSNPNLATHVITSIGNDAYLTLAKGPLSTSATYPTLKFPAHILIIPLAHSPTLPSITPAESKVSTFNEMQRYRTSLQSLLDSSSKGALGAVTWEISRAEGIHTHWQFLPVPSNLIKKGLVEAAFKVEAENDKYPAFKTKDIGDGTTEQGDFFRLWIWRPAEKKADGDGDESSDDEEEKEKEKQGIEKSLILPLSADFRFNLQFGRVVMAKLLGLETRYNWRDVVQSDDEDKKDANAFKAAFKEFDFSLGET